MAKERIILGVDPGTQIMGYGVIKVVGTKPELLCLDIIKLNKFDDHFLRLENIFNKTLQIMDEFMPDEMALEAPFYGKNVQSMLKLGRAQGVVMAAGLSRKIPVCEYLPKKVKQSITGNGNASKEQVAAMLQRIFNFKQVPKYLDATDGLAVAVCHFFQQGAVANTETTASKPKTGGGKRNTWEQFVKNNPEKLQ